jgi:hypothetical protein
MAIYILLEYSSTKLAEVCIGSQEITSGLPSSVAGFWIWPMRVDPEIADLLRETIYRPIKSGWSIANLLIGL